MTTTLVRSPRTLVLVAILLLPAVEAQAPAVPVMPTDTPLDHFLNNSDPIEHWAFTPRFFTDSPYEGWATVTEGSELRTRFNFGARWITLSGEAGFTESTSMEALNGQSSVYYEYMKWEKKDPWYSAPYWTVVHYSGWFRDEYLTGESAQTDADNPLVPTSSFVSAGDYMALDTTFHEPDRTLCTGGGALTWETGTDKIAVVEVSMSVNGVGINGRMSLSLSRAYEYHFVHGHCWQMDALGVGGGYAFNYLGPYDAWLMCNAATKTAFPDCLDNGFDTGDPLQKAYPDELPFDEGEAPGDEPSG